jgi:subtilisin family serine protease
MGRMRRATIVAPLVLAAALAACAPPPPPPSSSRTGPPLLDCALAGSSTSVGPTSDPAVPDDGPSGPTDPLGALAPEELASAVAAAAEEAAATGSGVVTIVTSSSEGPEFHDVPLEHAEVRAGALGTDGDVVAVEAPVEHHLLGAPSDPLFVHQWSFGRAPFHRTWPCGRGSGLVVAVVDTGVQGDHPDLAGRVLPGYTKLANTPPVLGTGAVDPHGHGTHVAGIVAAAADNGLGVAGAAPAVTVLPVRVLGPDGSGTSGDIAAGIRWAVDNGADVINLSLGSPQHSAAMSAAIDHAVANDVLVVAAAGNSGPGGAPLHPAADPDTVAVASITSTGALSSFSTRASYVDLAAPGSSIRSTCIASTFCDKSGTSMAAPHVAALAILVRSANPGLPVGQLRARLVDTADDAGPPGHDHGHGWGVIDPVEAVTGRPG